jgi:2-C-methyl-D-erythritol 4-phosphate cytidylyltransferase
VRGGAERYESVRLALNEVTTDAELVAVHDAVRPCVLSSWIDAVFAAAGEHGAAILAAPLTGTIKRVASSAITETVPRAGLYEAQTPQVFHRQLLQDAYSALPGDARPTDDAEVVERAGHAVRVVTTDRRNLKITTSSDMALAEQILKDFQRQARPKAPRSPFEEAQW